MIAKFWSGFGAGFVSGFAAAVLVSIIVLPLHESELEQQHKRAIRLLADQKVLDFDLGAVSASIALAQRGIEIPDPDVMKVWARQAFLRINSPSPTPSPSPSPKLTRPTKPTGLQLHTFG